MADIRRLTNAAAGAPAPKPRAARDKIEFRPIGVVHSPFKRPGDIPREMNIEIRGFDRIKGEIEILPEFEAGLKDLKGFSHLIVIFAFHDSAGFKLLTKPPGEKVWRGLFSTRSPHRPNPVGMTVVKLTGRKGNRLRIRGLDMIEGTPVLDIKPYLEKDRKNPALFGWTK